MFDTKDGYVVTKVEVTHLGQDYGKVQVWYENGEVIECEVPLRLAESLKQYLAAQKSSIRRREHNAFNEGYQKGKSNARD